MPAEDPAVIERRMYVDMHLNGVDDPTMSLADLRDMGGGGVNAYKAARTPALDKKVSDLGLFVESSMATVSSLRGLRSSLDTGSRSCAIQLLGDSTADATDEWFYGLGQLLAADYSAWTVQYRNWNDTTQDYNAPITLQTGPLGPLNMVCSSGTQTRRLQPSVSPHIAGVIDVRVKMSMTDWTPAVQQVVTGKQGAAGARSWWVGLTNTASGNRPTLTYSVDGTALALMTVIGSPVAADGDIIWLRWVFTPDNGAGSRVLEAYQSTNGVSWTQIGATLTTAGAVTIFNNATEGYALGGESSGANASVTTIYEVEIRDGRDGPSVVPALPDLWPPNVLSTASTMVVTGSPVLTVLNGSKPGANIAYWADPTRLKKAIRLFGQVASFLSLSHNQDTMFGSSFMLEYDTWRKQVETLMLGVPTTVVTQNPETAVAVNAAQHAQRRLDLLGLSQQLNFGAVDTFKAFLDYGFAWETDLMLDSIHPNAAGSLVWRNKVYNAIP